jgi:hypothetical protein
MPEVRIDEQLFRLLKNPDLLETLVILIERRASPSDIAEILKFKLNKATYCVKELEKMLFVEEVDTERRRGQTAHIYKAVMRPIWEDEEWAKLSQDERERYAAWGLQLFLHDVAIAWRARTFQARTTAHTSRSPLRVDEQGWLDLNNIQHEALKAMHEVEVESDKRLKRLSEAGNDGELIIARAAMFCIEMPPPAARK